MTQILPTVLVLLLTALIGVGLYVMVQHLDRMGGEGRGVRGKVDRPEDVKSDQ